MQWARIERAKQCGSAHARAEDLLVACYRKVCLERGRVVRFEDGEARLLHEERHHDLDLGPLGAGELRVDRILAPEDEARELVGRCGGVGGEEASVGEEDVEDAVAVLGELRLGELLGVPGGGELLGATDDVDVERVRRRLREEPPDLGFGVDRLGDGKAGGEEAAHGGCGRRGP